MHSLARTGIGAALGGLLMGFALPGAAQAQARLDARYVVTLAGITLGEGSWLVDVADDKFSAEAKGSTSGLARFFSSGQGTTASRGAIKNGQLIPANYAIYVKWGKRFEDLRMKISDGAVKELTIASAHDRASRPHPCDGCTQAQCS